MTKEKLERETKVVSILGVVAILFMLLLFSFCVKAEPLPANEKQVIEQVADEYGLEGKARQYTDDQIADAIYKAEGSEKASSPFGILSIKCEGYDACRHICLNTIRNNRKRYADYGYKQYNTYLEFLASRYAPIGVNNDPNNLNINWINNVQYWIKKLEKNNEK